MKQAIAIALMIAALISFVIAGISVPAGVVAAIYSAAQGVGVAQALWIGAKFWMYCLGIGLCGAVAYFTSLSVAKSV